VSVARVKIFLVENGGGKTKNCDKGKVTILPLGKEFFQGLLIPTGEEFKSERG
jgi:hypothetical protein